MVIKRQSPAHRRGNKNLHANSTIKKLFRRVLLLNERNIKEVSLWNEYILAAAALDILDKDS